jgi:DNA mismatch repair protein MutS2
LAIARRLGVADSILRDAEARVPDSVRRLDTLLAAVEERQRDLEAGQDNLEQRSIELDSLAARLAVQQESQSVREAELKRREKEANREGRKQARSHLMEARQLVEQALAAARGAVDEAAAREARRLVEEGITEQGKELAQAEVAGQRGSGADALEVGARVRLESGGTGEVAEVRADGKIVVMAGAIRLVADPKVLTPLPSNPKPAKRAEPAPSAQGAPGSAAPLEIDLRGMTGDEAESATVAAVDAAVLAEQPYLRIIHGMGTGVVRERVRRVVSQDRRVSRYAFAPRNQGGTGVTIVEFSG